MVNQLNSENLDSVKVTLIPDPWVARSSEVKIEVDGLAACG